MEKKKNGISREVWLFYLVVVIMPCIIICTTLWLILSEKWLSDAMGYCVNTVMVVSSWMIVAVEVTSRLKAGKSEKNDNDFKIVDCMTIILTVITICYSFLQISMPPIAFSQIAKLIIWFSAIIIYTVWVHPTRIKVLGMCLVATLISTLFVMPITYREHYEEVIEECKRDSYPVGNEESYDILSSKYTTSERVKSNDGLSGFETLMEDDFFKRNYSDTLYPLAKQYMEYRKTDGDFAQMEDVSFTYALKNLGCPNVAAWSSEPYVYEVTVSSVYSTPAVIKTERIAEVGFEAERMTYADGNTVWVQYRNIKGLSGYKSITFLRGFVEDTEGRESTEMPSVQFKFWGYDFLIWMLMMLVMLAATVNLILERECSSRKVRVRVLGTSVVFVALFLVCLVSLIL